MNRAISLSLVAMLSLIAATSSQATTILMDFGHDTQETALPSWNNVSGATSTTVSPGPFDLTNTSGDDTGIDMAFAVVGVGRISGNTSANYLGPYPAEIAAFPTLANQDSFFVQSGGTITATLSLLNPKATYDFLFYAADGNSTVVVPTTWLVTGANSGGGSIADVRDNDTDVVIVTGIIADLNDEVSILMSSGGLGRWNILQITENIPPVPEPSTFALLGLGMLGLMRRRCRKRRMA